MPRAPDNENCVKNCKTIFAKDICCETGQRAPPTLVTPEKSAGQQTGENSPAKGQGMVHLRRARLLWPIDTALLGAGREFGFGRMSQREFNQEK
jgi:hypothetical protein